jgi:CBS domain-containing protein
MEQERPTMNIGTLMTRDPGTCGPDDTLNTAAQIMWEKDCGCVPIVDAERRPVAMITDRDICMAAYTQGRPLWSIPVSSAASRGVLVVHDSDAVEVAESLMQTHRIRRLPVVDAEGRVIGILSMNDLARHALFGHRHAGMNADRITRTLAAICDPTVHATAAE